MSETEKKSIKKWSEMSPTEKLAQMPEYKKVVIGKIEDLKKKLSEQKLLLKSLENEEKAIKFEIIEAKAKADGKDITDLM